MSANHDRDVVKTYRYLRLGALLLLVLLGAAVLTRIVTDYPFRCIHNSISAYYYTPVRPVFVATLGALGASLLAYRGNGPREDVLLNFTGVAAAVVAFVPSTETAGGCLSRNTNVPTGTDTAAAVFNNGLALMVVGVIGLLIAAGLAISGQGERAQTRLLPADGWARLLAILTSAAVAADIVWFWVARRSFVDYGHEAAAISTFVGIVAVVLINAWEYNEHRDRRRRRALANRYGALAILLVLTLLVLVGLHLSAFRHSFPTWLFWLEASTITQFAVFWLVQTIELWGTVRRGLPQAPKAAPDELAPADIDAFVLRFVDAWNSHDSELLIALTAPDVEWEDPFITGGRLTGHDDLAAWLRSVWRSMPDLRFTLDGPVHVSADRASVMAGWRGVGTMTGPLNPPGYAPTRRQVVMTGHDRHTFRGGKLARVVTVTDVMAVGRQIGAAPPPGSRAERIGVALQRLAATRGPAGS